MRIDTLYQSIKKAMIKQKSQSHFANGFFEIKRPAACSGISFTCKNVFRSTKSKPFNRATKILTLARLNLG